MINAAEMLHTSTGSVGVDENAPSQLLVHTIANRLWLPMLAMGGMLIVAAAGLGIAAADDASKLGAGFSAARKADLETLKLLTSGTLFLGEAFILSGISFLLAAILGGLRMGGGMVQESVGTVVKTLKMPWSTKAFLVLMMMGVVVQFVAFGSLIYVATQAHDAWVGASAAGVPGNLAAFDRAVTWATWANPLREVSFGLLLGGIVFALYTISNVLGFQVSRIRELIMGGDGGAN